MAAARRGDGDRRHRGHRRAPPPPAPSIRAIVLNPSRYLDQKVTITGQYSGRNLLGDLPDAPAKSRYDFVLRSADAAIWVINMRPKPGEGKEFELALDSRIDTGRWLQVRGTMQQGRGLQWLDAEAGHAGAREAADRDDATEEPIRVPAGAAARSGLQRADRGRNRRPAVDQRPDPVLPRHRSGDAERTHPRARISESQSSSAASR